jgi:hypothetical protein
MHGTTTTLPAIVWLRNEKGGGGMKEKECTTCNGQGWREEQVGVDEHGNAMMQVDACSDCEAPVPVEQTHKAILELIQRTAEHRAKFAKGDHRLDLDSIERMARNGLKRRATGHE